MAKILNEKGSNRSPNRSRCQIRMAITCHRPILQLCNRAWPLIPLATSTQKFMMFASPCWFNWRNYLAQDWNKLKFFYRINPGLKIEKVSYIHLHIPLNIHRNLFCHIISGGINRSLNSNFYYSPRDYTDQGP